MSFVWLRRLFLQHSRHFIRQRSGWIPALIRRRPRALPALAATLPLWLVVRAAERVEYANETSRPSSKTKRRTRREIRSFSPRRRRRRRSSRDRHETRRMVRKGRISEGLRIHRSESEQSVVPKSLPAMASRQVERRTSVRRRVETFAFVRSEFITNIP